MAVAAPCSRAGVCGSTPHLQVAFHPILQHIEGPCAGPACAAGEKFDPRRVAPPVAATPARAQPAIARIRLRAFAQRSAQPFFPRQRECAFSLHDDFLPAADPPSGFDEQGFWPFSDFSSRHRLEGKREFDDRMIEEWHANFEGTAHAHGVGVAQQSIQHVGPQFEPGNARGDRRVGARRGATSSPIHDFHSPWVQSWRVLIPTRPESLRGSE